MDEAAPGRVASGTKRTATAVMDGGRNRMTLDNGMIATLRGVLKNARYVLPLAALTMFLAACSQVGTNSITFWDIIWSMVVLFFMVMYFMIFITIFMDIFRRNDLSGAWKVIWILFLFIIPLLSALVYVIARPKVTAQDVQMAAKAEAANKAVSQVSTADELAKLQALKDAGTINEQQYEDLKKKLLA
jgi:ABC-type multidrug transport system fused ATPase/permease subunit